jgi:hypothetical protein
MTRTTAPRRSRRRLAALLLFALPAMGLAGEGRRGFDRSFKKTLPLAAGQKLWIEHSNGEIRIETHRQPEVSIEASIHVSSSDEEGASKFSNEIEIEAVEKTGGVPIRTRYPDKKWSFRGKGYVSYAVEYQIRCLRGPSSRPPTASAISRSRPEGRGERAQLQRHDRLQGREGEPAPENSSARWRSRATTAP